MVQAAVVPGLVWGPEPHGCVSMIDAAAALARGSTEPAWSRLATCLFVAGWGPGPASLAACTPTSGGM